ncbi:hypothetical protein ACPOLB_08905 [Rubrivivax sp. RP6-9]|uniref:hypothetical protein n=1 Tax=Rubrivivax sp. RP6-9 TaxID=3415750 RepID=UPI003CC5E908
MVAAAHFRKPAVLVPASQAELDASLPWMATHLALLERKAPGVATPWHRHGGETMTARAVARGHVDFLAADGGVRCTANARTQREALRRRCAEQGLRGGTLRLGDAGARARTGGHFPGGTARHGRGEGASMAVSVPVASGCRAWRTRASSVAGGWCRCRPSTALATPPPPTWIDLVSFRLVQIPWALALPLGWGHTGAFWGVVVSETAFGVFTPWLFTRGRRKTARA